MTNEAPAPVVTYTMEAVVRQHDVLVGQAEELMQLRAFQRQATDYIRELEGRVAQCQCNAPEEAQEGTEG